MEQLEYRKNMCYTLNMGQLENVRMMPGRETNLGVYVWQNIGGDYLGDSEGNLLNVGAKYGDLVAIAAITREAKALGFPEGEAVFLAGRYRCTEEQFYQQVQDMLDGRRPDVSPGRV